MGKLFQELKRRKVFRVAAVYAVVAWLLIQIAGEILPTFEAPLWINQILIVVLMLGFPLAMVLSWAVNLTPGAADSINISDATSPSNPSNESWNSIVLGLVVLTIVFLIVDRYWLTGGQATEVSTAEEFQDVTRSSINLGYLSSRGNRNFRAEAALTPDGSKLIYQSRVDGTNQLYLRDLSTFSSRELLDNPNNLSIRLNDQSVSPDGKYVFIYLDGEPILLSLETGARQPVAFANNQDSSPPDSLRGYDWLSDEGIIYATVEGVFNFASFTDGEITKLDIPKSDSETLIWPHVLPENRNILYTETNGGEVRGASIAIFDRESGVSVTLINDGFKARYVPSGHIVFVRDNELRAITFNLTNKQVIGSDFAVIDDIQTVSGTWGRANYAISESGRLIYGQGGDMIANAPRRFELRDLEGLRQPINIASSGWGRIRLSPDGEKVLLHSESASLGGTGDVFIYYIANGVQDRRTFKGVRYPIWSKGGESFAYIDASDGAFKLEQLAVSGMGQPELLYSSSVRIEPFAFTPDSSQLLHTVGQPGNEDLNAVPTNHEAPISVSLVSDSSTNETNISISPDGRWIAYNASERNIPGYNIYVRPFPVTDETVFQLTYDGGANEPRWGPNSDEIFYYDSGRLMRLSLDTESGLQRGQPEVIYSNLAAVGNAFAYDVAADGKTFLVSLAIEETAELAAPQFTTLSLVDNWFEELNRLVPTDQN